MKQNELVETTINPKKAVLAQKCTSKIYDKDMSKIVEPIQINKNTKLPSQIKTSSKKDPKKIKNKEIIKESYLRTPLIKTYDQIPEIDEELKQIYQNFYGKCEMSEKEKKRS